MDNVINFVHYKATKKLLNPSLVNLFDCQQEGHPNHDAESRQLQRSHILIDLQNDDTHQVDITGSYAEHMPKAIEALAQPMDELCPPYTSPITARPRRRCAYSTPPTLHSKKPPEGGLSSNATALEPEVNETTNASQPSLRTEQEEIKHTPRPWYRGEIEIDSGGKA